jgi:arylsulfatase A-like enzyme
MSSHDLASFQGFCLIVFSLRSLGHSPKQGLFPPLGLPNPQRVTASRRLCTVSLFILWPLLGGVGCSDRSPPPNVLLISIDTLRADHTSVYGYERATTPTLEALAEEGARFDAAYAPTATTAPSHASLFTSLYPPTHRVVKNGRVLAQKHETLAEVLARWGYQCGAVVSSYVLNSRFEYDQGFESWNDDFSESDVPSGVTPWEGGEVEGQFHGMADDTTRRAIRWLESRDTTRPFFLFVHYFDPHDPYSPPAGFAERFEATLPPDQQGGMDLLVASYDGEIAYTDQEIGRLLKVLTELGLSQDTLVVAVGDHGEGLMDHGHLNHGVHLYEEAVRVPLILRFPDRIPAGRSVSNPVELTDVAPTILELLRPEVQLADGASPAGELLRDPTGAAGGRSLASMLAADGAQPPDPTERGPIYFYRRHYEATRVVGVSTAGEKFALRDGRWKYILGDVPRSEELYDLEADPGEQRDRHQAFPKVAARLSQQLATWRRSVTREDTPTQPLPESERAKLRALGYVD